MSYAGCLRRRIGIPRRCRGPATAQPLHDPLPVLAREDALCTGLGHGYLSLQTARHTETQLPTHACHQMAATPDEPYSNRYEHLVRYYGYYSNRSRGARRLIENGIGAGVDFPMFVTGVVATGDSCDGKSQIRVSPVLTFQSG
jgi:hypothetical protein